MLPTSHGWLAAFFYFFLRLGPFGLVLLGALDSSFLALPFANDLAVIVLVSLHHPLLPIYVAAATAGSVIGCWIMYVVGKIGGESLLRAHMSKQRFDRMQRTIGRKGPVLLAVPALIPPPFPFSAFVLGAGALEVPEGRFLGMLAGMRALRFLAEGLAALYFGRAVARWMRTPGFELFIEILMGIAILASAYSIYRLVRATRSRRGAK
jgi:membrane protein YqaA with SNARE-associated domain